jgi:hypothetical protein
MMEAKGKQTMTGTVRNESCLAWFFRVGRWKNDRITFYFAVE